MIKPLTSLRFFFAMMVFMSHLNPFVIKNENFQWLFSNIFSQGALGVSFFFILSGFILALNYNYKISNNIISKKEFWIARGARIYPLHLLTLVFAVIIFYWQFYQDLPTWLSKIIAQITLTQSFIFNTDYNLSFNSPAWSISCEAFFYLMFPFIIKASENKVFKYILIILFIILLSFATILSDITYDHLYNFNPIIRIFDFIIGIYLFKFYQKNLTLIKTRLWGNIFEFLSILVFITFFIFHSYFPRVYLFSIYYWIPMVFLILAFSYQKGSLSELLSKKALILLGEISFGFYMFHFIIIHYVLKIKDYLFIENKLFLVLLTLFISLVVSFISYYYFELKANRLIKQKFRK